MKHLILALTLITIGCYPIDPNTIALSRRDIIGCWENTTTILNANDKTWRVDTSRVSIEILKDTDSTLYTEVLSTEGFPVNVKRGYLIIESEYKDTLSAWIQYFEYQHGTNRIYLYKTRSDSMYINNKPYQSTPCKG